jgi:hypothetical protein
LNTFTWDLRYTGATTFDGMIIWSGRPERGPKAPPGSYQVRLRVGDMEQTRPLELAIDPNLKGVTEADLVEQFELASAIRDSASAANEAVIRIRALRSDIEERLQQTRSEAIHATAGELLTAMQAVEEALYQVKNRSGQDPLNFPISLNNRLASLRRSVETGDAKPTDAAYQVFEELSAELATQLDTLDRAVKQNLPQLNRQLEDAGLPALSEARAGAEQEA